MFNKNFENNYLPKGRNEQYNTGYEPFYGDYRDNHYYNDIQQRGAYMQQKPQRSNINNVQYVQDDRRQMSEPTFTIAEAKEMLRYDELVAVNQKMQKQLHIIINQQQSKHFDDKLDTIDEVIEQISQTIGIPTDKIVQYAHKKIGQHQSLEAQMHNLDFWRMIGDEMNAKQKPFVTPDSIISSTESKRVADSIVLRARRGEKVSDAEIGRAILNLRS